MMMMLMILMILVTYDNHVWKGLHHFDVHIMPMDHHHIDVQAEWCWWNALLDFAGISRALMRRIKVSTSISTDCVSPYLGHPPRSLRVQLFLTLICADQGLNQFQEHLNSYSICIGMGVLSSSTCISNSLLRTCPWTDGSQQRRGDNQQGMDLKHPVTSRNSFLIGQRPWLATKSLRPQLLTTVLNWHWETAVPCFQFL